MVAGGGGGSRGTAIAAGRDGDDEGVSPVEFIQFNSGNNGGEDEEVEEIAAANSQRNVVDDTGRPRPQSMPALGSRWGSSATAAISPEKIATSDTPTSRSSPILTSAFQLA